MHKAIFGSAIIVAGLMGGAFVFAEETQPAKGNLQFPIVELGNCQSQGECKTYCDDLANTDACLSFAEAHAMMSQEEVATAKKFKEVGMIGPGGCKGTDACQEFCDNKDNVEACIAFAETNDLMSKEKLQESKKVVVASKQATNSLNCNGRQECDKYCATTAGMEACIKFGTAAGIMPVQQQENARKVLAAVQKGAVPPCHGVECEKTCNVPGYKLVSPDVRAACEKFRTDAGIQTKGEMKMLQRIMTAIKSGMHPAGCDTEEACREYCSKDVNLEACVKFAETEAGLTAKESAAARGIEEKVVEGPGGCTSKEACNAFCSEPDNSQACFDYAKSNGKISDEELKKIEESQQKLKASLNNMPPAIAACLDAALGAKFIEKLKNGEAVPGPSVGETIKACFLQSTAQPKDGAGKEADQPGSGTGSCGDGRCGSQERADPSLCPQDCGDVNSQTPPPTKPTQPMPPTEPGQPSKPTPPAQPPAGGSGNGSCGDGRCGSKEQADPTLCPQDCGGAAGQKAQPSKPTQPKPQGAQPSKPSNQTKPTPPTQPTQPKPSAAQPPKPTPPPTEGTGSCGDGRCSSREQADPLMCPQDCKGATSQTPQPPPPPKPTQPPPPSGGSGTGSCGDGRCGSQEQANPSLCPQDCGGVTSQTPQPPPTKPTQPPPPSGGSGNRQQR